MNIHKLILLGLFVLSISGCDSNSGSTATNGTGSGQTSTVTEFSAIQTFDEFWQLFDRHYPLMHRKDIDWEVVYQDYQQQITSATTHQELATMFGEIVQNTIKDGHTSAQYKQQEFAYEPAMTEQQQNTIAMLANTDGLINYESTSVSNPYISYGRLKSDSNIGYIKSKVFEPSTENESEFTLFKQIVDSALLELQDTQGIIIDIRTNGGGSGELAYYFAGRFATNAPVEVVRMRYKTTTGSTVSALSDWVTDEFAGYADNRAEGGFIAPTDTFLNQFNASGDFQYANKVALLTSKESASAAEFFTVVLKTQSQVQSFGDNTFGIFAGSEMVRLNSDKDWTIRISVHDVEVKYNEVFQSFEGIGIPVDNPIYPTQAQISAGQDMHIEAAIDYINGIGQ